MYTVPVMKSFILVAMLLGCCEASSEVHAESSGCYYYLFDLLAATTLILLVSTAWLSAKLLGICFWKGAPQVLHRDASVQCSLSGYHSSAGFDNGATAGSLDCSNLIMYHTPSSTCWHTNPECHHIRKGKVKAFHPCTSCKRAGFR